jgi:hypothetical protein
MRRTLSIVLTVGLIGVGAAAALAQPTARPQTQACTSERGGTANVLAKAQAFTASLTPAQRQAVVVEHSKANAIRWTNVPFRMLPRNGLRFGDMDAAQKAAARRLIGAAMSSCGAELFDGIQAADGVLNKIDATRSWDAGNYAVAFVGAPSASSPWMLQVAGHHLFFNLAYNGAQVSATPLFDGVEPLKFSYEGRDHEPLAVQMTAMRTLAGSLEKLPAAKLSGTFTDVTRGPQTTGDVNFPMTYPTGAEGRGAPYASLSAQDKARVRAALRAWVDLPGEAISSVLLRDYTTDAALAQTYVGFSGDPGLTKPGGYVRIDGPRLWIEFITQAAIADPTKIHYHTIWRDKTADYGGAFKG